MPEEAFLSSAAFLTAARYRAARTELPADEAGLQPRSHGSEPKNRHFAWGGSRLERRVAPEELVRLLTAEAPDAREEAWAAFTGAFSRLLLHTARSRGAGYDVSMDRYAYVLEQLRRDDYCRLRRYRADGRGKFTTWLVVVARRLCLDHDRQRFGRFRQTLATDTAETRRRLVDLLGEQVELESLGGAADETPEGDLRAAELRRGLALVLADLSARDRLLLKLRFEDELSAPAIARLLAFPTPFHVYRRLNALLRELRTELARRGIRDSQP